MKDKKTLIQESLMASLTDYYADNQQAQDYLQTNLSTPQDVSTFAVINNIDINYNAPNMQVMTESFKFAINKKLKKIYG